MKADFLTPRQGSERRFNNKKGNITIPDKKPRHKGHFFNLKIAAEINRSLHKIGKIKKSPKPDDNYDMKRYLAGVSIWNHHFTSAGSQTGIDKQYFYTDALGSLVLITDAIGTVQRQYAYDAWGRRVDNSDWSTVLSTTPFLPVSQQPTTQGFTGQDMLDAVGLIHYGGRIYDQKLGRFVQADPGVPYPLNLQSHNRYSYVRNNPLGRVDPTGYADLDSTTTGNGAKPEIFYVLQGDSITVIGNGDASDASGPTPNYQDTFSTNDTGRSLTFTPV